MIEINAGWIGTRRQLIEALESVGADRTDDGAFKVYGSSGPVAFMGDSSDNAEMVIPGGCEYSIGGRRCNLASLLGSCSGMRVTVF